jgi:hypothetical protein
MRRISPRQAQLLQNLRAVGVPLLEQPYLTYPVHVEKVPSLLGTELVKVNGGFVVLPRLKLITTGRIIITRLLVRGQGIELRNWPLPICAIHPHNHCWHLSGEGGVSISRSDAFPMDAKTRLPSKTRGFLERYLVGFVSTSAALTGPAQVELEFGVREMGETYWFSITCGRATNNILTSRTESGDAATGG